MNDLLLKSLRCEPTPRRPIWVMRQAGRYLPEYRALRSGRSFLEMTRDPAMAAEVTLLPIERFGFDAAIVFADLVSPLAALGIDFRFEPGPVTDTPIRGVEQINALRRPAPEEIAPEVATTLRLIKPRLAGRAALIGFVGAPLSLAAYLVQGRGEKGFPRLRALAAADPVGFGELLARLAQLGADYAIQQARAGADVIQVFDSWAGLLAPRQWHELVKPHLTSLLERLGEAGVPRIVFANDAPHLVDAYAALPSEGLAVDWRTDLGELRRQLGPDRALQGNLDPGVLLAGPEVTRRAAEDLLSRVPARGHIVNLGHGITPEAPLESVQALIDVVREEQAAAPAVGRAS